MNKLVLEKIFENVFYQSLNYILNDQIDYKNKTLSSETNDKYKGAWGYSTIDYVFLATRGLNWKPLMGSITHTAWALNALNKLESNKLLQDFHKKIIKAMELSTLFVLRSLMEIKKEEEIAATRHLATSILALFSINKNQYLEKDNTSQILHHIIKNIFTISNTISNWSTFDYKGYSDYILLAPYLRLFLIIWKKNINNNNDYNNILDIDDIFYLKKKFEKSELGEKIKSFLKNIDGKVVKQKKFEVFEHYNNKKVVSPFINIIMYLYARIKYSQYDDDSNDENNISDILINLSKSIIEYYQDIFNIKNQDNTMSTNDRPNTIINEIDTWSIFTLLILLKYIECRKNNPEWKFDHLIKKYYPLLAKEESLICSNIIHWSILVDILSEAPFKKKEDTNIKQNNANNPFKNQKTSNKSNIYQDISNSYPNILEYKLNSKYNTPKWSKDMLARKLLLLRLIDTGCLPKDMTNNERI